MANIIRSPKSGSAWTINDLDSYHISLNEVDPLEFFGLQELPEPSVDQELLTNVDAGAMQQGHNRELVYLLDLAMVPAEGEAAVDDFSVALFKVLGYVGQERVARTRLDLPLFICGEHRHAKTDVCIVGRSQSNILLLVQEDKRLGVDDAHAQMVAEAIAAFNANNERRGLDGIEPLREAIIPGIVMIGTLPSFYKVRVTEALSNHIRFGTYPPEETKVIFCYPPGLGPARRDSEGMEPLDDRYSILQCYEAFKAIVGI